MKYQKTVNLIFLILFIAGQLSLSAQIDELQKKIIEARDRVMPALVHVEPVISFYTTGERRHTLVTGSGFIFSPEGYILTNHHVIENAERVQCTLSNKKKLSAKVIGSDRSTDVAVLQLNLEEYDGDPIPHAVLGDSDSIEVGQMVLALGSPLGLSRSVSMGVISSIDRYFESRGQMVSPYNLWIQTDAAINPGNSGGPLINLEGKVVGINARGVFMAENLGFAIPITLAREVAEKLIEGKKIRRSWIGVELQPIKELREYLGESKLKGVLVSNIDPFSPAQRAGLQAGDIILTIGNQPINVEFEENLPVVRKIITDLPPKKEVELSIRRNGKMKKFKLTTELEPFEYLPEFDCEEWGLVVKSITRYIFQIQGLPDYDGVYVSAVKSGELSDRAGLMTGDVIRSINGKEFKNLTEFTELYHDLTGSNVKYIYFEVLRDGATYFAAMETKQ